jgi:hypothetical protein
MLTTMHLLEELVELEERLLEQGWGTDRASVEDMFAPEFVCFGSTGRMWTKETLLDQIPRIPGQPIVLSSATCYPMSDTSALLTYRLTLGDRRSLRSSLWAQRDGKWQRLFHQGTPAAVQN